MVGPGANFSQNLGCQSGLRWCPPPYIRNLKASVATRPCSPRRMARRSAPLPTWRVKRAWTVCDIYFHHLLGVSRLGRLMVDLTMCPGL